MSNETNIVRDALLDSAKRVVDNAKKVVTNRSNASYADGFKAAAEVCTGALTKNIADLMAKMKSAPHLNDQEQFLLASLTEIQTQTEKDLREFLDGKAADSA